MPIPAKMIPRHGPPDPGAIVTKRQALARDEVSSLGIEAHF